ncbi:Dehydrogenase [Planctomycetales bacterium 10988]|nr:Dehydrogenase [Planctomycetales bacterium 10988]
MTCFRLMFFTLALLPAFGLVGCSPAPESAVQADTPAEAKPEAKAPLLEVEPGQKVALVGGSLAVRMHLFGHFETHLQSRFPEKEILLRNFGWPTDEVGLRQRPDNYIELDNPYLVYGPDLVLCFFGFNESFAGPDGVESFKSDYHSFLEGMRVELEGNGQTPRFVLISPIAFEATDKPGLPSGTQENENLQLYMEATQAVAEAEKLPFVDLFTPTKGAFAEESGAQYTINRAHLNEAGDKLVGKLLDEELFGNSPAEANSERFEQLRQAVIDKGWHHQQDYRMVNGWYIYGGRNSPFGVVNFPAEYAKLRKMVAKRDQYIWDIAQGKEVADAVDDSDTGDLVEVRTTFGSKTYSEPQDLRYLTPEEALDAMTVAEGYEVKTFASEEMFPELANPVQMSFDNQGRLWVACMPTYPQWKPGNPKPADRLLILEDTDNDGVADELKVFADDLHLPTGFALWNGGVLVVNQPQLIFLKDTDGDDKADYREVMFDGFATEDTHHAIGAFEWTPGGDLIMLEGISLSTTIETPWGPFRNHNQSSAYLLDLETWQIRRYVAPCYANAWCFTHNEWGQPFVGDGTSAAQYWATPLVGKPFRERKGTDEFILYSGPRMRPALGNEFINSSHFPEEAQGNFLFACVINMNGILQFNVKQQKSGFLGVRVEDLVVSTDRNFRPGDPKIGPDGALYFIDWHNPLIGHMQYSQRDPNRDHRHGRVYQLKVKDKDLLDVVTQAEKSVPELLDQLAMKEPRTRVRVRRELRDRPKQEVKTALTAWLSAIGEEDKLRDQKLLEALWVQEGHRMVDLDLAKQVLQAEEPQARAAALIVLANEREYLPEAFESIKPLISDSHPLVRLQTLVALSYFPTTESVATAMEVLKYEMDDEIDYTLQSTLGALKPVWYDRVKQGESLVENFPEAEEYLIELTQGGDYGDKARSLLRKITNPKISSGGKVIAMNDMITLSGNPEAGKKVFTRACIACHMIGTEGAKFGPDLTEVGKRLTRGKIIESILEPSAELNPKYQTLSLFTADGLALTGLLVSESDDEIEILVGGKDVVKVPRDEIEIMEKVAVSSMPERLHETMSGEEFIDLLEFLSTLK